MNELAVYAAAYFAVAVAGSFTGRWLCEYFTDKRRERRVDDLRAKVDAIANRMPAIRFVEGRSRAQDQRLEAMVHQLHTIESWMRQCDARASLLRERIAVMGDVMEKCAKIDALWYAPGMPGYVEAMKRLKV